MTETTEHMLNRAWFRHGYLAAKPDAGEQEVIDAYNLSRKHQHLRSYDAGRHGVGIRSPEQAALFYGERVECEVGSVSKGVSLIQRTINADFIKIMEDDRIGIRNVKLLEGE